MKRIKIGAIISAMVLLGIATWVAFNVGNYLLHRSPSFKEWVLALGLGAMMCLYLGYMVYVIVKNWNRRQELEGGK